MAITMNSVCLECVVKKHMTHARQLGTDEQATELGKALARHFGNSAPDMDSALFATFVEEDLHRIYGLQPDRMQEEKDLSNRFVMERLEDIRRRILKTEDPVYAALQFSVLGNYLDFSALAGQVSFEKLDEMLDGGTKIELDREVYRQFAEDLKKGKRFLYITDNAGEICFDRVAAEIIKETCPQLEITFLVRGKPVSNDATREDAKVAGITFPVIDNGTNVGGTVISKISQEAREAIEEADVILAKGMGNTETMFGCGYNVYYAFLVKCPRFEQFFNAPKMKPMFVKDHN